MPIWVYAYNRWEGGKNPAQIDTRGQFGIKAGRPRDSKAKNRKNTRGVGEKEEARTASVF
jgi:hypothetical protein